MKFINSLKRLSKKHIDHVVRRNSSASPSPAPYFITTPIFYVNGSPHLGHAHTAVLADAMLRRRILKGLASPDASIFSTGTDEHGVKVAQAAQKLEKTPTQLCDAMSAEFRSLFDLLQVGYTDFVRTTEGRHATAVEHFWQALMDRGFIYKGSYSGWYSVVDEAYVSPRIKVEESPEIPGKFVCAESRDVVVWSEEENYLFRLNEFKEPLRKWLTESEVIQPNSFLPAVLSSLDDLRTDLSISRSRSRLSWGHPVPGDDTQTVYVWLDALVNYLTVAGYPHSHLGVWKDAVHVIGKDILKFHAIYWPAFLMAAELPLPDRIVVHSHWTVDNRKMSKSLNNVTDPRRVVDNVSIDGLRYFLLAQGVPDDDNDYTDQKLVEKLNAELCNTLGNLVNRIVGKSLNPDQLFPVPSVDAFRRFENEYFESLVETVKSLPTRVDEEFDSVRFYLGTDAIMAAARGANQFLQDARPWKMDAKLEADRIRVISYVVMETIRVCGVLLQPVVPGYAGKMLDIIGVKSDERSWARLLDDRRPFHQMDLLGADGENISHSSSDLPINRAHVPLYPRLKL